MRNKFTEWIEQGVAKFDYTPIAQDIPEQDIICRTYNNIFSIPTDTHMSCVNGDRVITGHMVGTPQWEKFICACNWGAINFKTSGYWCLCDFLDKMGLKGVMGVLNGDTVFRVIPKLQETASLEMPGSYTTSESRIPQPITTITTNNRIETVKECYIAENVAEALNKSPYIIGENWIEYNGMIIGMIGNKTIYLK